MPENTVIIDGQNGNGKAILEKIEALSAFITNEIKQQYLEDTTPWIIGFSGGKDSTAVLQLIFYALSELSPDQRHKEVHVLSNDTLVENPNVVRHLDEQLGSIEKAGKKELFPHDRQRRGVDVDARRSNRCRSRAYCSMEYEL